MANISKITLEALILTAGILKKVEGDSEKWYQVTSYGGIHEFDPSQCIDNMHIFKKEGEMEIRSPLKGLINTTYENLEAAERYVKACLSFNALIAFLLAPRVIENLSERKVHFASSYEIQKQAMHEKGEVDLLKSNSEFVASGFVELFNLSYDEAIASIDKK